MKREDRRAEKEGEGRWRGEIELKDGCEEVNRDRQAGEEVGRKREKEYTDTSRKERQKAEGCSGSPEVHRDFNRCNQGTHQR